VDWETIPVNCQSDFHPGGKPWVDLFATRANRMVLTFCSRAPDQLALKADPMTMIWSQGLRYAYPPLYFILPVLAKSSQGGGGGNSFFTMVASPGVVPPSAGSTSGSHDTSAYDPGSPGETGRGIIPSPEHIKSQREGLQAIGFSTDAAKSIGQSLSNRKSTKHYTTPSGNVFIFAGARNVLSIPFHCHVVWILEYLESLVTADLKHNTKFVSHISALSSCLPLYDGIAIGNHPLIYMVDP